ncbi:MAG: hypothetical protein ACREI3_06975, partial [Nitrospirales bacterium]
DAFTDTADSGQEAEDEPAEDLEPAAETSQPARARPPGGGARAGKPARRKPARRPERQVAAAVRVTNWLAKGQSLAQRAVVLLVLVVVLPLLALGGTAVSWLIMEEDPTQAFSALQQAPSRSLPDYKRNGYILLYGFGAREERDPMQVGYESWLGREPNPTAGCFDPLAETRARLQFAGDRSVLDQWFDAQDPAAAFAQQADAINQAAAINQTLMSRYPRLFGMAFEDWGFGHPGSPQCAEILATHRLYVAQGFAERGLSVGLGRLEVDLTAWRAILREAKSLSLKVLALQAVRDDTAVISGLLQRRELNPDFLPDLMRITEPLKQDERSLKWPMQDQFAMDVARGQQRIRTQAEGAYALLVEFLKVMPLPDQRILNDHAEYYDAMIKASENSFGPFPKQYDYVQAPAKTLLDYLTNPVDNILLTRSKPAWEGYRNAILEVDTRLRLAGLQARVYGAGGNREIIERIARAGSGFFDPFTGLPMLVNRVAGIVYSVGPNGMDDNGDPSMDITAPLVLRG